MNIVFTAAEAYPFAKVGGLADVLGALPKSLTKLGAEVSLIIPLYSDINKEQYRIEPLDSVILLDTPDGEQEAIIHKGYLPYTEIPVFFIGNRRYFDRPGIYSDPKTGESYPDDGARFSFFSRSVPEVIKRVGIKPDILHANDYQTALVLVYLRKLYRNDPVFKDTKTVFSIHNLAYQGVFDPSILEYTRIGHDEFYPTGPFEFWNRVNFMKLGILFSDHITTVSPTYAEEIQTTDFGHGLEGVLTENAHKLTGILNGVDYSVWNPATDPYLKVHFTPEKLANKKQLKRELLEKSGLPETHIDLPMIGMVTRMADQKGFDIIGRAIDSILQLPLTFVILGTGRKGIESMLRDAAERHPKKMAAHFMFNPSMAHLIEAGSDMFLMPSRYEPCGLNQMYSLKYGTVPIVRETGGLADTIRDVDKYNNGTGFVFQEYSHLTLLETIERAVEVFDDEERWQQIVHRGMAEDFSWDSSARQYIRLYENLLS